MKIFALLLTIFSFGLGVMALKDAVCGLEHSMVNTPGRPMCLAAFRQWSYNAESNECVEFIYGGCGGNENRFVSKDECEDKCKE